MSATWKTKWGVRRVRRDSPTIEEALIAAESLAADPGQRAEIAASLMGVPVDEVRTLAATELSRGCRCDPDYVRSVIARFPEGERKDMVGDDGMIRVDCAFCSSSFAIEPHALG